MKYEIKLGALSSYAATFLKGRRFYVKRDLDDYGDRNGPLLDPEVVDGEPNLVSSEIEGTDLHAPLFDLDVEAITIPSSTVGHSHLYFKKQISWDSYVKIMDAMGEAGLCDDKWVGHCKDRHKGLVRPPWVTKPGLDGDRAAYTAIKYNLFDEADYEDVLARIKSAPKVQYRDNF